MDRAAVITAFQQQKEQEIAGYETRIKQLHGQLSESPKIKLSGADRDRVEILQEIDQLRKKISHLMDCSVSLQSLLVKQADDDVQLGNVVTLIKWPDGSCQTFLLIAQGGGCSIEHEGETIFCLSLQAPLGQVLIGKKPLAIFSCKEQNYEVISIE